MLGHRRRHITAIMPGMHYRRDRPFSSFGRLFHEEFSRNMIVPLPRSIVKSREQTAVPRSPSIPPQEPQPLVRTCPAPPCRSKCFPDRQPGIASCRRRAGCQAPCGSLSRSKCSGQLVFFPQIWRLLLDRLISTSVNRSGQSSRPKKWK